MLASTARRAARLAGFELTRYLPRNFAHLRRPELLRSGRIDVLLDIGAADGGWAEQCRRQGYAGRVESFEPRADAFRQLAYKAERDPLWTAHQVALSDRDGSADLNVSPEGQASSLLPLGVQERLEPSLAYTATERVQLARLDDLNVEGRAAYLKADVQGHELQVLVGAERTLQRTAAVELELSFLPLYEGQALAHDLMGWLYERGFSLAAIEVSWRDKRTGDLLLANGLFLPAQDARSSAPL